MQVVFSARIRFKMTTLEMGWLPRLLQMADRRLCVGLIVLAGCFTLVITPDGPPDPRAEGFLNGAPTVIIDAGHGGKDDGAKSRGVREKSVCLTLALRLETILKERGFNPVLTRRDDRFLTLAERVAIANENDDASIFLSLHFNQGHGNGVETFYASLKVPSGSGWKWVGFFNRDERWDTGETLAAEVQWGIMSRTGARDRGIRPRDLYVTRNTRMPAILVEGGFLSSALESRLLQNDAYIDRIAEGIADGVEAWRQSQPRRGPMPLAKNR